MNPYGAACIVGLTVGGLLLYEIGKRGERQRRATIELKANYSARPGLWKAWRFETGKFLSALAVVLVIVGLLVAYTVGGHDAPNP